MRALQNDLDDARETRIREQEREARRARDDQQELKALRERCERLEEEHSNFQHVSRFSCFPFYVSNIAAGRPRSRRSVAF